MARSWRFWKPGSFDRMSTLPADQRPQNMVEALCKARARTLELKRGKDSNLKHVGDAVSYIDVLEQEKRKKARPAAS